MKKEEKVKEEHQYLTKTYNHCAWESRFCWKKNKNKTKNKCQQGFNCYASEHIPIVSLKMITLKKKLKNHQREMQTNQAVAMLLLSIGKQCAGKIMLSMALSFQLFGKGR